MMDNLLMMHLINLLRAITGANFNFILCLILRFRAAWIYYEGNCAKGFDYQKYNITELEFIEKPFVIKCVAGSGRTIFSICLVC